MRLIAKILVGLSALAFLAGVVAGLFLGGRLFNIPAESFARATDGMALIAIALLLWTHQESKS
jgi:hypothetical protein